MTQQSTPERRCVTCRFWTSDDDEGGFSGECALGDRTRSTHRCLRWEGLPSRQAIHTILMAGVEA